MLYDLTCWMLYGSKGDTAFIESNSAYFVSGSERSHVFFRVRPFTVTHNTSSVN